MDVLNHAHKPLHASARRRWPRWPWQLALVGWLIATACLSWQPTRRAEPSFPHRVHVIDNQLACSFCHPTAAGGERPGMPAPELCATCHDAIDAAKPPERRVAAFYGPDSRYRTVANNHLHPDVRFSHGSHVAGARLECSTCHPDVAQRDEVTMAPLVRKADCMDCHQRYGKANSCGECHREIDRNWLPDTHRQQWMAGHGAVVRCGDEQSVNRCELCHQDATGCRACHQQMAPADHDHSFRLRTHGLQASIDRSRCATCHTQDSCQQCHEQTRPLSHRGGFGNPQQRHCVSCHLPVQETGCYTCHRGTPSHQTATPLPPGHSAAMNCRLCHGQGLPLPHPDGGHSCTACHR